MKFSIITPSHNRPEQLLKCVWSVLNQDELQLLDIEIIIINDSPNYDYSTFENDKQIKEAIENKTIIYIKNKENNGKNYSCNLALEQVVRPDNNKSIQKDTADPDHYVIFLDDDDWLSANALHEANQLIIQLKNTKENFDYRWIVTNRAQEKDININNKNKLNEDYQELIKLTQNNTNKQVLCDLFKINYFWDSMIFKRFHGDATHIIEAKLAKSACFNTKVKNGKEWYYFAQLSSNFIYKDLNSTITNGYHDNGLSDKLQTKSKLQKLITTIYNLFIYMRLRVGKLIRIKNIHAAK